MGGQDKGLVQLNDKPLIEHVIERLSSQTSQILINANRNLDTYQQYGEVFRDQFEQFPGPMGGIHAGLINAKTDWVGFVPCDSPLISNDIVERFCREVTDETEILVAHDGDHQQPVFTLYHKSVLDRLTAFLERGDRKIILLYNECNTKYVDFSDSPQCFVNLNTPEELAQFGTIN
jgi:molybdopterin-guanine dinucleotide biosynthesis protein A